ncbi:MAG: hypothetical protein P0S95_06440 [Rhabdochlamydiaceae bacterium]|nr:hypothetical protein [Candidatus Amphrikana amoebophyrae]
MQQEKIWPLHSRAHKLNHLKGYIKREDELSFGVSGNKLRKLASLIPHLIQMGKPHILATGSCYSNFILGLVQHLNEHQFTYTLLLKKPHNWIKGGNLSYLDLLVDKEQIEWIEKCEPLNKERCFYIPEGAFCVEALYGSMELANSIAKNEQELGINFENIIIDSGTGLGAIGLILGCAQINKKWKIDIFNMCDTQDQFEKKLQKMNEELGNKIKLGPYETHELSTAKSYGSMNSTIMKFINGFAKREGVILDPLYSSKLFYELSGPKNGLINDNTLVIHSGGALSLGGFLPEVTEIEG